MYHSDQHLTEPPVSSSWPYPTTPTAPAAHSSQTPRRTKTALHHHHHHQASWRLLASSSQVYAERSSGPSRHLRLVERADGPHRGPLGLRSTACLVADSAPQFGSRSPRRPCSKRRRRSLHHCTARPAKSAPIDSRPFRHWSVFGKEAWYDSLEDKDGQYLYLQCTRWLDRSNLH